MVLDQPVAVSDMFAAADAAGEGAFTLGPVRQYVLPLAEVRANPFDFESLHRGVMALFPKDLAGASAERRARSRILFRVDDARAGYLVLIQSATPPQVPGIAERPLPDLPGEGVRVRFRVAVNSVYRHGDKARPVPEDEVPTWLPSRLAPALNDVEVARVDRVVKKHRGTRQLVVDTVDGTARVADTDALARLVVDGVGRAKAYGCGLLTIAAA
jgi:CRISPR system Cascade subunit CasE